jgi:DNA end-binding protein Ku
VEETMPRPSWTGFLKLSLVSCPIYLAPATAQRERIHLHQINPRTGNRITLQPVDAETGEAVERSELTRGYEYERGQYVILTKEELDELQIESSKTLDLTQFVNAAEVTPLYLDTPYYVYPDGEHAIEAYRVVMQAMAKKKKIALGRIVLTTREHLVAVEPYSGGLLMSILRSADMLRAAEFDKFKGEADPEMVQMAETIIERLSGKFDPSRFRDRYEDALRALVEAKLKGKKPLIAPVEAPAKVIDLMSALKRSVAAKEKAAAPPRKRRGPQPDQRQASLLLPIKGGGRKAPAAERVKARRRKRA